MRRTRAYLLALEDEGLSLSRSVQTFFSGSGYHLIIPNSVFNFEPSSELPYIVRKTMAALLPGIDDMVYIRSAIYRVPHTKNNKTNLYKIPLTIKELHERTPEEILKMAESPRLEFAYKEMLGEGELEHTIIT
jgi:hypothetical protein